jgi:subtilase family serine protease
MSPRGRRCLSAGVAAGLVALLGVAATAASPAASNRGPARAGHAAHPGNAEARVAVAAPYSVRLSDQPFGSPPTTAECEAQQHVKCYSPAQIRTAYDMGPLFRNGETGKGETIVLVDSFGSPKIRSDLATFDHAFGIAAPPSFKIVAPAGAVPKWTGSGAQVGWGIETSLDVEWAHAMAPGADIVLAETPVSETEGTVGFPQIVKAETWVIKHMEPSVISQSFGATEQTFPSHAAIDKLRGAYELAKKDHVTVLAASGDEGATSQQKDGTKLYLFRVVGWPSSDPLVTSVGGTHLDLGVSGRRRSPDTVWNDTREAHSPAASNGGLSTVFRRPSWQSGVAGVVKDHRGVPDVALSASELAGAIVYISFRGLPAGYQIIGGTSWASPLFAGIVAVADQVAGRHLGFINPMLYELEAHNSAGIVDITSGNNTVTFAQDGSMHTVAGYRATKGYDLASGLGTIKGAPFVKALAALASAKKPTP